MAVLLAVSLAVLIIGGVSLVIGGQLIELASSVPSYKQTISTKLRSLRSLGLGDGALEQVTHTVEDLSRELTNDGPATNQQPTTSPTQRTSAGQYRWSSSGRKCAPSKSLRPLSGR